MLPGAHCLIDRATQHVANTKNTSAVTHRVFFKLLPVMLMYARGALLEHYTIAGGDDVSCKAAGLLPRYGSTWLGPSLSRSATLVGQAGVSRDHAVQESIPYLCLRLYDLVTVWPSRLERRVVPGGKETSSYYSNPSVPSIGCVVSCRDPTPSRGSTPYPALAPGDDGSQNGSPRRE